MAAKAKKTTKKATRKVTKKKVAKKTTKRKTLKKKTVAKRKTVKKTAKKKTTKRKTVKKKVTKAKTPKKKAGVKRKVAKKKVAKKKTVKKKVTKKTPIRKGVPKRKAPVKKISAKKTPTKKMAAPKKKKRLSGPLFDRIVPSRPPEPATGDNPYNIRIVNMVASAAFNVELDLFALARDVDTIEYEPEQFPGAILKLTKENFEVKASLLLFKNGKVICTGARSEEDVARALMKTSEIIADFVS